MSAPHPSKVAGIDSTVPAPAHTASPVSVGPPTAAVPLPAPAPTCASAPGAALQDRLAGWVSDLTTLHELTERLARTDTLPEALDELLRAGAALVGARRGLVTLAPPDGPLTTTALGLDRADLGHLETVPRHALPHTRLLDGLTDRELLQPDLSTETPLDPRHREVAARLGYAAVYGVTLNSPAPGATSRYEAPGAAFGRLTGGGGFAGVDGGFADGGFAGGGTPGAGAGLPTGAGTGTGAGSGTGTEVGRGPGNSGGSGGSGGPSGPSGPGATGVPGTAGSPDTSGGPGASGGHGPLSSSGNPGGPNTPDTPRPLSTPATPGTADSPDLPGWPGASGGRGPLGPAGTPGTIGSPTLPGWPGTPDTPGSPNSAGSPGTADFPDVPSGLGAPNAPGVPGSADTLGALGGAGLAAGSGGLLRAPGATPRPHLAGWAETPRGSFAGAVVWFYDEAGAPDERRRHLVELYIRFAEAHVGRLLEVEHTRACMATIAEELLPSRLPRVAGMQLAVRYRSGTQGGGDWYDALPLPDAALGLSVGAVTGSGPSAVAAMGRLRASLRAYAVMEGEDPVAVLSDLELLLRLTEPARSATALFAYCEPALRKITLAGAGHCPPLLVGDHRTEFVETSVSAPLGMLSCWEAPSVELEAEPGETVLLYTDGLLRRTGDSMDRAFTRLHSAAASVPRALRGDPGAVADHVLRAMLPEGADSADRAEDVVLLAARFE